MHHEIRWALAVGLFVLLVIGWTVAPRPPDTAPQATMLSYVPPKGYVCVRATKSPRIDGKLTDEAWQEAPWSDDFVDIEADKRPRPRYKTRVKMLWDDTCLYIAAELTEPHVQASLTRHDSYIFHNDNDFEVFLDPDGDNQLYAELEMNALNTTWDLLLTKPYRDGGRAIDAWEIDDLRTAVHVDGTLNDPRDVDRGWTIEIAWPWKGLKQLSSQKAPPRDGDQWRINFSRVQWEFEVVEGKYRRKAGIAEDNWVWSPQHIIDMHAPERWGYLQFSTAPAGAAAFRPDPAGPARHVLQQVHEAQLLYRKQHHRWATSLSALGLNIAHTAGHYQPRLEATAHQYEARLEAPLAEGGRQSWSINSNGRIAKD